MSDEKQNGKNEPKFLVRPGAKMTKAQMKEELVKATIAHVNQERAAKGLPPMPKE